MNQKHTSRNTSINSSKLPAIYNKPIYWNGKSVIDYGCGRYTMHLKAQAKAQGAATWAGYDPYNQTAEVNAETAQKTADIVLCSNVLNVIDNVDSIYQAIRWMWRHTNKGGQMCVTVYEGNGTGEGKETQNGDSWQRNEKLKAYLRYFHMLGIPADAHHGMIVAYRL